jgi:hypothetical protein
VDERSYHYIIATFELLPETTPLLRLTLAEGWYGIMVLLPYGHPPHIKYAKRLLYV